MSQRTPTDTEIYTLAKEFILHGDQVRSWRVAFPNSKAILDVQYSNASTVFKLPKLRKRIKELQSLSKKQSEEEFNMTVGELKKILSHVMLNGSMQGKLSAVVAAVAEFNKMDGNNAPTKTEITADLNVRKVIRIRTKKNDKYNN